MATRWMKLLYSPCHINEVNLAALVSNAMLMILSFKMCASALNFPHLQHYDDTLLGFEGASGNIFI